ncbi:MAG: rod shape-determining protein MreC [Chloroflexota bacterium]
MLLKARSVRRQIVVYVLLIAFSMLLLAFSSSPPVLQLRRGVGFAMAPIQQTLHNTAQTIGSVFGSFGEIDQLRQQNEDLARQLAQVQAENQGLASLKAQNDLLTALLDVHSSFDYQTVAAEVISKRITDQERSISLDRGEEVGIELDDPVIGPGGSLIGQVVEVGANYARVLLITDTRIHVAGLVESSRAVGLISGHLGQPMDMENIPADVTVNVGESVVTAGIELAQGIRSPFPKGLLVGTIAGVSRSPDQLFQTALVTPVADLDRLEYVLVITNYEGGLPETSPSPTPEVAPSP